MRRRKHNRVDPVDQHRWVVSYADFITLLFAFFVVMYAISSVNDSKYQSLTEGMHSAFNKRNKNRAIHSTENKNDGIVELESRGGTRQDFDALSKALTKVKDLNYKLNKEDGWIEMDIKAGSLFDSSSVNIKPVAMVKLMQIANIVKNTPYPLAIEGYTDNRPINTPQFPSNWELSAARAAAVARVLNSYGVDSDRITVTGFGEQHPKYNNSTSEGRANNRRVNIIIARDRGIRRLVDPKVNMIHHTVSPVRPGEKMLRNTDQGRD